MTSNACQITVGCVMLSCAAYMIATLGCDRPIPGYLIQQMGAREAREKEAFATMQAESQFESKAICPEKGETTWTIHIKGLNKQESEDRQ